MKSPDWNRGFTRLDADTAAPGAAFVSHKDYTPEILDFLRSVHGKVRQDDLGDYYYEGVSTISLHFLLNSPLPPKETLWAWYDYFDRERSESIYQTLPPLLDEAFLRILEGCAFRWDAKAVRASGLVFLSQHRKAVYADIEAFLTQRLDEHRHMDDDALRAFLTPKSTWTEAHLRREVRRLQTRRFDQEERQTVYRRLHSDYLRATARHLMDEAATEAFWKHPPPELEALRARFQALRATLAEAAVRLGVYVTREAYEWSHWRQGREGARRSRRRGFNGQHAAHESVAVMSVAQHFAVLGLTPAATLPEVKAAYREKVKAHHPDSGGSVPDFLRLQEAYEFLLTQVF
ncbi:MAG TPA: DnaJ domain-containing protein [bacterium]|nr:DnaJ domain-containing protein [bacterium]